MRERKNMGQSGPTRVNMGLSEARTGPKAESQGPARHWAAHQEEILGILNDHGVPRLGGMQEGGRAGEVECRNK